MSDRQARRVAVTGLGTVHPGGGPALGYFEQMMRGESAVRLFTPSGLPLPVAQPAVHCEAFAPEARIGRPAVSVSDRFAQMALVSALDAWDDAGLESASPEAEGWGVAWGVGAGAAVTIEKGYTDFFIDGRERASPLTVPQVMNNAAASQIAIALGLGGMCTTYSIACSSSAVAVGEAFRAVQRGDAGVVLAGGSEAPLSFAIMRAWEAMRVIPKTDATGAPRACRPFHAQRSGLVLAEGAAALVVEDWAHAKARGARIYCEILGYGQSCDHNHLVRPQVKGQIRAIRGALNDAGLQPEQIGYVNAHGTATLEGDPVEIEALKDVFGAHAPSLAVSATKSMHGHLLGATGAMEALVTVLALHRQEIPPTANLDAIDPKCAGVDHVCGVGRAQRFSKAISNSFAFGGTNAVLAFGRAE